MIRKIARARSTTSRSRRRRGAATRPASRAPPPTTASTSSRCSRATARSTRPPTGCCTRDTALAPLPGGSTNVYAQHARLSRATPIDADQRAARVARTRRRCKRIGVGLANGRPFLFNTGIGFDAAVIRRVERYGELKRYASHPLHIAAAFDAFFRTRAAAPRVDIDARHRRADRGRPLRDRLEDRRRTRYLGRLPARRRAATPGSTRRCRSPRSARSTRVTLLGGAASSMRIGQVPRAAARASCTAHDLRRHHVAAARRSRTRSTATTSATPTELDIDYEPDALVDRRCRLAERGQPSAASATSGTFVMIASTPAAASARDLVGVVDRPHARRAAARRARPRSPRRGAASAAARSGFSHAVAVLGRDAAARRRPILTVRQPAGRRSRARTRAHASTAPRSNDGHDDVRARAAAIASIGRRRAITRAVAVGVGLPRQALDLDVDEQARARVERLGERRRASGRAARSVGERRARRSARAPRRRGRGARRARRRRCAARRARRRRRRGRGPARTPRACSPARAREAPRWPSTSGRSAMRCSLRACEPATRSTFDRRNVLVRPLAIANSAVSLRAGARRTATVRGVP